jgi:hypothetical protein
MVIGVTSNAPVYSAHKSCSQGGLVKTAFTVSATPFNISIQCNLCNPTPEFSGTKVFLLTKIKPEYSDILYNPTQFRGLLVCGIRQVPLYYYLHHEADIIKSTL